MLITPHVTWKPWKPVIVKNVDPYMPATPAPYFTGSASACSASSEPSRYPFGVNPCPTSLMYSTTCTPTNPAPQMIVTSSQNLSPPSCSVFPGTLRRKYFLPSAIAAYALTIETDEQISRKVFRPVSGTLRTAPGCAHGVDMPKRSTMYEPISAVKNITSLARKTHIPSLLL